MQKQNEILKQNNEIMERMAVSLEKLTNKN
jgi:hypothetical protein